MFGSKRKIQQLENQVHQLTEKVKALEIKSDLRVYSVEVGKTVKNYIGTSYNIVDKTGVEIKRGDRLVVRYADGVKCLTGEDVI